MIKKVNELENFVLSEEKSINKEKRCYKKIKENKLFNYKRLL